MKRSIVILLIALVLKALFALGGIYSEAVGLGPDEAQYWTWSQMLDWGYYSKPPGIAWQIWLGTKIFGNTELGVRFMAVVMNFFLSLAVYGLARCCRLKKWTAFWAAIAMAFSPLGILGSFLATTDGGLVLFWTLACAVIAKGLSQGKTPNYLLFGLMVMCGSLFKWPIYLLWVFVFLAAIPYSQLRCKSIFSGILISFLGLFPSFIWNAQNDWATFRHVLSTIQGGHAQVVSSGNFWDFFGAQAALVSPILFILLLLAIFSMLRNIVYMWPSVLFCGMITTVLVTVYSAMALNQKMQGNWVAFAYPTGMVLLAWYTIEQVTWGKGWMKAGVIVSIVLSVVVIILPISGILPYKMNPFRHNLGWKQMKQELADAGYDPDKDVLFGDKYQTSSLLSFYSPEQKRAYFMNINGVRKNQFSYWPSMPKGKNGYFVLVENAPHLESLRSNDYQERLQKYFSRVELLGFKPLLTEGGKVVKESAIYRCFHYNGKAPEETKLY
jgi:hypothetical protein